MTELTPTQQAYIQGLRDGDSKASQLVIRDHISAKADGDFATFDRFLKANGHPNPEPADLFLNITRKAFLRMLYYADDRDRNCLILQNCFGYNKTPKFGKDLVPPEQPENGLKEVGRIVLIQKGNFQQRIGQSDSDLFFGDSVYRNAQNGFEMFLNMDASRTIPFEQALQYINNFLEIYPGRDAQNDAFIHGYLLPVKALINLFTDPNHPLGRAEILRFQWGLTKFIEGDKLGNFTLAIGAEEFSRAPVIEFRNEDIVGTGDNDCPPNTGCPPKNS